MMLEEPELRVTVGEAWVWQYVRARPSRGGGEEEEESRSMIGMAMA